MAFSIMIIGIGNDYRSDDGVGLRVVRSLQAEKRADAICLESSGDGATLMETWGNADCVIIVDALFSGKPPGTISRLDAIAQPIPADYSFPSTHAFSIAEAVQLARTLNLLPASLIIYGIEGKNFAAGTDLLPEVESAASKVITMVTQEVFSSTNARQRITHQHIQHTLAPDISMQEDN